ncbi:MAG: hypothetical protein KJ623_04565 [Nanoarchaeota archaeon]|nr:hypothetical protein [Nanoarchaeota archaeon]MBU0962999.1 hypothetical protein [Nanoarchaeota archaeon]
MVRVKLQKRKSGNGDYYSTVITIPNSIIESMSCFKNAKEVDLQIKDSFLLIKPIK